MSYVPRVPPTNPADLSLFLLTEFQRISQEWSQQQPSLQLQTLYAAPDRPREGMIVVADGTTWNPGSGAGAYLYRGSAWHFLG